MTELLSASELEVRLRHIGAERYHDRHPFHELMNSGRLTKGQLQAWALNRYYYQSSIPIKDAAILSRMADPELRRVWRQRLVDHDGDQDLEGGIARWLALAEGLGLDRGYITSLAGILPEDRPLVTRPPFADPHHSASRAAIVGGGAVHLAKRCGGSRVALERRGVADGLIERCAAGASSAVSPLPALPTPTLVGSRSSRLKLTPSSDWRARFRRRGRLRRDFMGLLFDTRSS